MKKQLIIFFLLTVTANCMLFGQDLSIEWQNTIGSTSHDYLRDGMQTADGGFIFAGTKYGNYWIVKTDATGETEWDKTIIGNFTDELTSIQQTIDGGYIVGGYSTSGIDDDKTEANYGFQDYWILKLNATGDIEWQNSIGGSQGDFLYSVRQTTDGGYIVGGSSESGITGDKTEISIGNDIWLVKLNSTGTIVWQNTITGNADDYLGALESTPDGGCVLVSTSNSNATYDKTEAAYGDNLWVLKIDATGNIQWQNTLNAGGDGHGGAIKLTSDGGYIVGGYADEGTTVDKTEYGEGGYDYWIVKLNSLGVRIWDNTIGGSGDDWLYDINQTSDGGYFVGGFSNSEISGDKSEPRIPALDIFVIYYDYWSLKLDGTGTIKWQNTIGGNEDDKLFVNFQTTDGGFLMAGYSSSEISGDKTEGASLNSYDFWIVKLFPDPCSLLTEICNGFDDNCNLLTDDADPAIIGQPTWYADADLDGYGDPLVNATACNAPPGMINNNGDCNDADAGIHPGVTELYNATDDNCDGLIDNVTPIVSLQNTIGGTSNDYFKVLKPTSDGGYILGGKSYSDISIDKNEESVNFDYWVVKIDAALNIEWQNTISGNFEDELTCIDQTSDGG
ncbi:MAG: putative metal-binding motif-containing protein, partial [Chitinophagales bacterium]